MAWPQYMQYPSMNVDGPLKLHSRQNALYKEFIPKPIDQYLTRHFNESKRVEDAKSPQSSSFLEDLKKWLKQMSRDQLHSLLCIKDQNLVNLILRMFWHDAKEGAHTYALKTDEREYSQSWINNFHIDSDFLQFFMARQRKQPEKDKNHEAEELLIKNISILDSEEIMDTLSFTSLLIDDLELLFKVFKDISDSNAFSNFLQVNFDQQTQNYQVKDSIWFIPSSY